MVIRIFYIAIAIFSVAMVILSVQTPYFSDFFKEDLSVANMEMTKIEDFEVSENKITGKFSSDSGVRYKDRDEFNGFLGEILGDDVNHTLSSKKAIRKNDVLTFFGDAKYKNSDNLNYISDEIIYNTKTKIAQSNMPFVMTQYENKVVGANLKYDLNKKQTFATGVHGWFQTKEKTD
ncbi:Uncharacterised protein [Campylobacter geochelonis]|uniref:LPS export ABC transporter periplasmic protein LptC n=1 Tax=Campylobacter geochelonis TaxID=1780362 RepID=A0A128ERP9_9BACT|nr:LPS export ABC transporter periplasmic protein LptC [Campylobacter geochelonis]QKF71676.1 lipooligosaccharide transport system, periplasmic component LptC [Campylobacter geochelonis]CZE49244.1 Uncharacterised protein [Campylobacter geochelonis]CZE49258.1 Uncharacterised protein [Campylobacter geochelonis]CZE51294.1 Uncharacterised protein [Campylobacter geochelonis]